MPIRFIQYYKNVCRSLFSAALIFSALTTHAQISANQPVPKGFSAAGIRRADSLVSSFMLKYHVPGLSLAIAKNDQLKLQRSYGYADTTKKERVTTDSRFRIASVSKTFTSTAIMLLVQEGRLHLSDKVFGEGAVLGATFGSQPYKKWITDITIQNLLEHTGGGWGNSGQDPMFMHTEMNQRQLINWTLDNVPLVNQPGTHYEYSNFGFCLLGRVIEIVSGLPYAVFVKKNILNKCGITTMEIGGNTLTERKPDEVCYYDENAKLPYEMNERRMDSHGGWIATPTDLVKLLVHVNYTPQQPELLKTETLNQMYTVTLKGSDYAKGWVITGDNHWHNGSLPGEQALAVNTGDGLSWAVLVNTRTGGNFSRDLDELMWKIKYSIKTWPDVDLF